MLHDHFSTNIKHGATYALQDLFSVQLRGENLKSFISNWDQVLAGIVQTPAESVLETLFYKQVKSCKAIQHDMNEYHRADEGTEKRTYAFLVSAVRRHLDRERLEANRDRVAKGLSGRGSMDLWETRNQEVHTAQAQHLFPFASVSHFPINS